GERRIGKRGVPCPADVRQVLRRHLDRRELAHLLRASPWQDGGRAVGAGVRKPRLCGGNQASRDLCAPLSGELPDDYLLRVAPRELQGARRKFVGRGNVEE